MSEYLCSFADLRRNSLASSFTACCRSHILFLLTGAADLWEHLRRGKAVHPRSVLRRICLNNRAPRLAISVCFLWAALPASSQVPLRGSGLTSIVDPVYGNAVREYYVGADQHVHELFLYDGHWQDADIIAITGGVSPASVTTLTSLFDSLYNGVRTDYIGTDQHIHELFLSGGIWQNTDLTATTGGAALSTANGLTSVVDPAYGNAVRQYDVGVDQHVHELFLYGGHWQDADLTTITGGPSVESLPPDPSPVPYPDYLSTPPSSPPGACNITGNWADSTSLGSSWSLTEIGANVVGTYQAMIAPLNPSCGSITWHVTGTYSSGIGTFVAASPSSAFDQCGNPASSTINATAAFGSCSAAAAQETSIIPPWKNQFGQSGPGEPLMAVALGRLALHP